MAKLLFLRESAKTKKMLEKQLERKRNLSLHGVPE